MRFYLFVILSLIASVVSVFAQKTDSDETSSNSSVVKSSYDRSSLTVVFLNYNEKDSFAKDLKIAFEGIQLPDKYNDNQVDVKFVSPDFDMRLGNAGRNGAFAINRQEKEPLRMEKIGELLKNSKISSQIVAKWFNKTPDGKFDMSLVAQRGLYNATDAQYNNAKFSQRGITAELKDAGKKLVDKSYVLVLDFGNILSMTRYYDIWNKRHKFLGIAIRKKKRVKAGFITDIKGYLFKIDGDVVQKVYDIWDQGSKFDKLDFPLTPVIQVFHPRAEGTETKIRKKNPPKHSREEFFKLLVKDAVVQAEFMLAKNYEDFRVKAPVDNARGGLFPVTRAKIGKKEGLTLDTRYFVYEKTLGSDGKMKSVRKGVLGVSNKIVDNRSVTTGNTGTTKFYQVMGKKIKPGMLIQQATGRKRVGLNFGIGYPLQDYQNRNTTSMYKSPLAFILKWDYNVSPYLAKKFGKWFTEMRIYGEYRFLGSAPLINAQPIDTISSLQSTPLFLSFGVSKDIHLIRNIKLSPFAQFAFSGSFQLGYGAKLPINLNQWLEFVPGISIFEFTLPYDIKGKTAPKHIGFSKMYIEAEFRFSF